MKITAKVTNKYVDILMQSALSVNGPAVRTLLLKSYINHVL